MEKGMANREEKRKGELHKTKMAGRAGMLGGLKIHGKIGNLENGASKKRGMEKKRMGIGKNKIGKQGVGTFRIGKKAEGEPKSWKQES